MQDLVVDGGAMLGIPARTPSKIPTNKTGHIVTHERRDPRNSRKAARPWRHASYGAGYHGTIQDIVESVGMKGSFYNHFPSKEAFSGRQVLHRAVHQAVDDLRRGVNTEAALKAYFKELIEETSAEISKAGACSAT